MIKNRTVTARRGFKSLAAMAAFGVTAVIGSAFANAAPATAFAAPAASLPFPGQAYDQSVSLDRKEVTGLELANKWKNHFDKPIKGADGSVVYYFGGTLPSLVCAGGQVCVVKLEPGEIVRDIHVGDLVRWKVHPATEGADDNLTTLLMVKPLDQGLVTNMVISTDRRLYVIKLVSTAKDWMPMLSFEYPESINQALSNIYSKQQKAISKNTIPQTGQNVAGLDFNYRLSGDTPSWKPLRVYSDGNKTYIQFPTADLKEAPALVALGKDDAKELVNYRAVGDRYVVDKVLQHAALIIGVGSQETKVEITHMGAK